MLLVNCQVSSKNKITLKILWENNYIEYLDLLFNKNITNIEVFDKHNHFFKQKQSAIQHKNKRLRQA